VGFGKADAFCRYRLFRGGLGTPKLNLLDACFRGDPANECLVVDLSIDLLQSCSLAALTIITTGFPATSRSASCAPTQLYYALLTFPTMNDPTSFCRMIEAKPRWLTEKEQRAGRR
jgi:hypothetical protein